MSKEKMTFKYQTDEVDIVYTVLDTSDQTHDVLVGKFLDFLRSTGYVFDNEMYKVS